MRKLKFPRAFGTHRKSSEGLPEGFFVNRYNENHGTKRYGCINKQSRRAGKKSLFRWEWKIFHEWFCLFHVTKGGANAMGCSCKRVLSRVATTAKSLISFAGTLEMFAAAWQDLSTNKPFWRTNKVPWSHSFVTRHTLKHDAHAALDDVKEVTRFSLWDTPQFFFFFFVSAM